MTAISIKLAVIKQQSVSDVKRILDNDAMFAGTAVPCNNVKCILIQHRQDNEGEN